MGCSSSSEAVARNVPPPTSPNLWSASTSPNPLRGAPPPPPQQLRRKSAPHPSCVIHPDPVLERRPASADNVESRVLTRKHRSASPQDLGRVVAEPTPEQIVARLAAGAELAAEHGISSDPEQFTSSGVDPAASRRSSVKCARWIVANLRHQVQPYDPEEAPEA